MNNIMTNKTYQINLKLQELLLLDTKVSAEAQEIIDKAKQESKYGFEIYIMNEILRKSEEIGTLTWKYKQIRGCGYCDKKYDYYTYARTSRNHYKGEKNYDSPKYYQGIKFNEGYITTQGQGDMCSGCEERHNVIHRLIDYIIDNDLRIEIQKNNYKPSKYLKDKIRICYECGKEIKESEMGSLPTVMGNGYYKGKCPYCGAEEKSFGKSHKLTSKFDVIENPESKEEVQNIKLLVDKYNKNVENKDKIRLRQSKNNINTFYIEEVEWRNGYSEVVNLNVKLKKAKIGCFYKNKCDLFIEELNKHGYEIIDSF